MLLSMGAGPSPSPLPQRDPALTSPAGAFSASVPTPAVSQKIPYPSAPACMVVSEHPPSPEAPSIPACPSLGGRRGGSQDGVSSLRVITLGKHAQSTCLLEAPPVCSGSAGTQVPFRHEIDQVSSGPLSAQLCPIELCMSTHGY